MKIIISNYRYFLSGGPERYMFNVMKALQNNGDQVIPFSIDYSANKKSEYSSFFVTPIGNREEIYFEQQKKSIRKTIKAMERLFYSFEVENHVRRLITTEKPEIAYVLHYLRKLSPSLLVGIKKENIPIVVRLSDYGMICPETHLFKNNEICTLCLGNNFMPSIRKKCVKNSKLLSVVNVFSSAIHSQLKFFNLVDLFVCTNEFMYDMMVKAGYSKERLVVIPTFTDLDMFTPRDANNKNKYIVYLGRIEFNKGVHVLIEAFNIFLKNNKSSVILKIIGSSNSDYMTKCEKLVKKYNLSAHVKFTGKLDKNELISEITGSLLSVIPSIWYENLPNSLLESYACGVPVIASKHGSLEHYVKHSETGFLFEPGNAEDLSEKLALALTNLEELNDMRINARKYAEDEFNHDKHIKLLKKEFHKLL